tara:strand:+ start:3025 stop:3984 length:960 start_codon:yes stop_codon:yes gene_type:complete
LVIISEEYSELEHYNYDNSIVTVGSFDGLHLGHQKIFQKMHDLSLKYKNSNKILITFDPHPYSVLNGDSNKKYYLSSTLQDKVDVINSCENIFIDVLVVLPFTKELSLVSASKFLEQIIKSFNPTDIVMGHDNGFGHKREGNVQFLNEKYQNKKFKIHEVKPKKNHDMSIVSSTLIREFIVGGNIKKGNLMLGRYYSVVGTVIKGDGIGKTINFPTINISPLNQYQIIPALGVYFVKIEIGNDIFDGMCNIGFRPTVTNSKEETIEIHIFRVETNKDFYNKKVKVFFVDFIRKEKKFKNINLLKEQLEKDKQFCLSVKV